MSDEYSLHGRFLMGKDSAAEYERRLARLRRLEAEREADLAALASSDSSSSAVDAGSVLGVEGGNDG